MIGGAGVAIEFNLLRIISDKENIFHLHIQEKVGVYTMGPW